MPKNEQTTTADTLRKRTLAGQQHIAEKRSAEREKAKEDDAGLQRRMQEEAKTLFSECMRKAGEAADKGETEVSVSVALWEDKSGEPWVRYLSQYTIALLEKEGFRAKDEQTRQEPNGSDPMFWHTVYNTYLRISWDKK